MLPYVSSERLGWRWRLAALAISSLLVLTIAAGSARAATSASWPSGGHDISNSHSNSAESMINPHNVVHLAPKWKFTTHGDVSAISAVVGGYVYFPDWGGYLNKVDATTGALVWSVPIANYETGAVFGLPVSRTAPAVAGNTVYVGDQNGAHLLAINATTGQLIWNTQVDSHPAAILTAGPLVYNGVIYQGVASQEEAFAASGTYPCCTFRGSEVAVDATTGKVLWQTFMVPSNGGVACKRQNPAAGCGYSGGAVWGTTPAVDPASNTLYVGTGNNYTVPDSVKKCQARGGSPGQCLDPNDHVDSIVALDATTGMIKWATGTQGFDDWNVACIPGVGSPNNCPPNPGPDYDFGSGPQLFTIKNPTTGMNQLVVGAGEKSGTYWALDAGTGNILWSQAAGPGSSLGGIEWGPAYDGKYIYVAEENFYGIPYKLPSGQTITGASWAAIDPTTGKIVWQVPDPSGGGTALGPVSVADGVVYAPSMSGNMYALDAQSGNILWSYQAQGSAIAGAAIVNGNVYWGDGYSHLGIPGFTGATTFYDFTVNGN